jgi:predicted dehydrogenase
VFNLGVIGLGSWMRRVIGAVQGKSDQVRYTGAWSRSPDKVKDFCAEHGIAQHGDMAALLADPDIQGVVVGTPVFEHAAQVNAALDAGKHVLVIKPLVQTKAEAEALFAKAVEKGLTLAVAYDRCFLPSADALRQRVKAGDLGQIVHAEANFCVPRYFGMTKDDFKGHVDNAPPGSLADHMIYTMIELMGPVAEVDVHGLHLATDFDTPDTTTARLRFASGASGSLTTIGVTEQFYRLHVFGTAGWAEMRGASTFEFAPVKGDGAVLDLPPGEVLRRMQEAFATAAAGGTPFPFTPEASIAGSAVLEALRTSHLEGRPVKI